MSTQKFRAQARDRGGDWVVMLTGSPQECRTKVVKEAGSMVNGGDYVVVGMNRSEITVQDVDDPAKQTEFRISKVVEQETRRQCKAPGCTWDAEPLRLYCAPHDNDRTVEA